MGTLDANEAVASVAYRLNEFFAIYPITPSSPMAEFADEWSAGGKKNLWGAVPSVVEMQSEGGAAGTAPELQRPGIRRHPCPGQRQLALHSGDAADCLKTGGRVLGKTKGNPTSGISQCRFGLQKPPR